KLVLLLDGNANLSNTAAAAAVGLSDQWVRKWRRRWDGGDFSLDDRLRSGRPPGLSPRRAIASQSCGSGNSCGKWKPAFAAIDTGCDDARGGRFEAPPQPQRGMANPRQRSHQAVAISILDLPARPGLRGQGPADPRFVRGVLVRG